MRKKILKIFRCLLIILITLGVIYLIFPGAYFKEIATGEEYSKITIDKALHILIYESSDSKFVFPCATGLGTNSDNITPEGSYKVINKSVNPIWYWEGKKHEPYYKDKSNGLGIRWMGISLPTYGIHGTNDPFSIGKSISHGCIRLQNNDVSYIFPYVSIGTSVDIVSLNISSKYQSFIKDFLELYDLENILKSANK